MAGLVGCVVMYAISSVGEAGREGTCNCKGGRHRAGLVSFTVDVILLTWEDSWLREMVLEGCVIWTFHCVHCVGQVHCFMLKTLLFHFITTFRCIEAKMLKLAS